MITYNTQIIHMCMSKSIKSLLAEKSNDCEANKRFTYKTVTKAICGETVPGSSLSRYYPNTRGTFSTWEREVTANCDCADVLTMGI